MKKINFKTGEFWVLFDGTEQDLEAIGHGLDEFGKKIGINITVSRDKDMLLFQVYQPLSTIDLEENSNNDKYDAKQKENDKEKKR